MRSSVTRKYSTSVALYIDAILRVVIILSGFHDSAERYRPQSEITTGFSDQILNLILLLWKFKSTHLALPSNSTHASMTSWRPAHAIPPLLFIIFNSVASYRRNIYHSYSSIHWQRPWGERQAASRERHRTRMPVQRRCSTSLEDTAFPERSEPSTRSLVTHPLRLVSFPTRCSSCYVTKVLVT